MQKEKLGRAQTVVNGFKDRPGTLYARMGDGRAQRIGPRPVDIKRQQRKQRREQKLLGIEDVAKAT